MPDSHLGLLSDVVVLLIMHSSGRTRGDWLPFLPTCPRVTPITSRSQAQMSYSFSQGVPPLVGKEKGKNSNGEQGSAAVAFPTT